MANLDGKKTETVTTPIINKVIDEKNEEAPPNVQITQEQHNQVDSSTSNVESTKQIKIAKKPPDILCNCPQKCDQRVPQNIRSSLYKEFCSLGDHIRQNAYLQSFIEMRSVYKRLWCQEERIGGRLQRRVSCKYKIPVEVPMKCVQPDQPLSPPKLTTNSKGQATIIVGVQDGCRTIEVCQKAFMNVYGITEKRIRLQREKLIARLRGDNPERHLRVGNSSRQTSITANDIAKYGATINNNSSTVAQTYSSQSAQTCANDYAVLDDEFTIVDTFFRNQLWKPEYIGIPSDKLQYLDMYYNNVIA